MFPQQIRQQTIVGVLIGGFTLVIALMMIAGYIGFGNVALIRTNAQTLVSQDLSTTDLIDQIQSEQAALGWVFHKMDRDPESMDRNLALKELHDAETTMKAIQESEKGGPQEKLWHDLQTATTAFANEARRLLATEQIPPGLSRNLFQRHADVLKATSAIIRANDRGNIESQRMIAQNAHELFLRSTILLGICLLLAIACAVLTVRVTTDLFRRMEWQTAELGRVSFHMLENQETTARRFSHELHDELGQSLTAVKANLAALEQAENGESQQLIHERLDDCLKQVNEAIGNVRQLSQLLRPIILDDFGLDAALRWLSERFQQRTHIDVEYHSNFNGRLPDETETHLFRISQEALTNIARHSGAKKVRLGLQAEDNLIRLTITDDGRGLQVTNERGLGLTGMRARARSIGGELTLGNGTGGLKIEVSLPREQKDPHPVGR